jgi:hypothetical protein
VIRKILLVPAVAGLLVLNTPVAHAALVASGCGLGHTGATDTAAAGYAVFDDQGSHTLRCYVTVDGVERATTPTATGTGVVVTAGPVSYATWAWSTVAVCTEVDGVTTGCDHSPDVVQSVFQTLDRACQVDLCLAPPPWFDPTLLDPLVCPLLGALAPGVPGVVDVTPYGDVTVAGVGLVWDCPPYGV